MTQARAAVALAFLLCISTGCGDDSEAKTASGACTLPATGQTTAQGTGSDGDVRAGAPLSYMDNGDGTITDNNTGLMWEKKDDGGGIHDQDNTYTWGMTSSPYTMNGTMVTTFLATLNTTPCFAGYCDWRIPNVKELHSIVNYEIPYPGPLVDPAFHQVATCRGCTDVTLASCSCTRSFHYWSSTTNRYENYDAWLVDFSYGLVSNGSRSNLVSVRAVRGGS